MNKTPMGRLPAAAMLALCLGGVGYEIHTSPKAAPAVHVAPVAPPVVLQIVGGQVTSDKLAVLADPAVKADLAAHGAILQVGTVPGRDMIDLPAAETHYAFSWTGDDETAAMIAHGAPRPEARTSMVSPFYTVPVVLTWGPAADILAKAGIVTGTGRYRSVDMGKLADLMLKGRKWSDLPVDPKWQSDRPILVRTPDLGRSGAATPYLGLLSQSVNGGRNVGTSEEARKTADQLAPLFRVQGAQAPGTAQAMTEYLSFGISRTPLLLTTEAEALQMLSGAKAPQDAVVLYPTHTVIAQQTLVPYNPTGVRVANLLSRAVVRDAAIRHGFRAIGSDKGPGVWASGAPKPPATFATIVDMPQTDFVELMIDRIDHPEADADQKAKAAPSDEERQQVVETAAQQPDDDADSNDRRDYDNRPDAVPTQMKDAQGVIMRPVIDPEGDPASQQAAVARYVARLNAYRALHPQGTQKDQGR